LFIVPAEKIGKIIAVDIEILYSQGVENIKNFFVEN